ncbi:unnamed protein product [Dimorphilus gyrociliatus]|uniref:Uncharacterized protein n=1 Tax=Dimorphilus gyrociliatus TaxID=2664684 RepID=A0A7I8VSX5_9ANNE|nr:unnamed protein product [Dimorphilus gyrociliatus]
MSYDILKLSDDKIFRFSLDMLPTTEKDYNQRRISPFIKGAFGLILTASIDMLIGFSTSYWATWEKIETRSYGGYGLWKMWSCSPKELGDGEYSRNTFTCSYKLAGWFEFPGWYVTTQVFSCIGFAGMLLTVFGLAMYICRVSLRTQRTISVLITIGHCSGFSLLVSLAIFGFKVVSDIDAKKTTEWYLSWSFTLICTAFVLNEIAASVLASEKHKILKDQKDTQKLEEDMRNVLTKISSFQTK